MLIAIENAIWPDLFHRRRRHQPWKPTNSAATGKPHTSSAAAGTPPEYRCGHGLCRGSRDALKLARSGCTFVRSKVTGSAAAARPITREVLRYQPTLTPAEHFRLRTPLTGSGNIRKGGMWQRQNEARRPMSR